MKNKQEYTLEEAQHVLAVLIADPLFQGKVTVHFRPANQTAQQIWIDIESKGSGSRHIIDALLEVKRRRIERHDMTKKH